MNIVIVTHLFFLTNQKKKKNRTYKYDKVRGEG